MSEIFGGGGGGSGSGAPTDATYLTLTSNGDLSAEVIVREPFNARIQRDSTTEISLQRYAGLLCVVNGEAVDPGDSGIACATTDNLISNTGADSGGAMGTSTLYYIYLSNSQASFAASDLRASTTAPSLVDGVKYLGTSGNALHWRFVGWVRTNGSTQFSDDVTNRLVVNYYNRLRKSIRLTPGYTDDNAATTYTMNSTTFTPVNGGTGATGSYIANGEDAIFVTLQGFFTTGSGGYVALGIGDNSTTTVVQQMYNAVAGTGEGVFGTYATVPAEGYRTLSLLGRHAVATGTIYADDARAGSTADPYSTALCAEVMA